MEIHVRIHSLHSIPIDVSKMQKKGQIYFCAELGALRKESDHMNITNSEVLELKNHPMNL
jgi:hypothetical protein